MKHKYLTATVLVGALHVVDLGAQPVPSQPLQIAGTGGTEAAVDRRTMHSGAIYQLKLRVPWEKIETYLATYARWYLPVDQYQGTDTTPGSGRKLLDVVVRENGDHYNLVFMYWYRDRFKENYYCDYDRAFFNHHQGDRSFQELFLKTAKRVGASTNLRDTLDALAEDKCKANNPPPVVTEVIRAIDSELRKMVELNEASWDFGVNPCRVWHFSGLDVGGTRPAKPEDCKLLSVETLSPQR